MNVTGFFQNRDRVFALVLMVVASIFYALIGDMEEPYSSGALSASTYPRLILACIMVLSGILIIRPVHEAGELQGGRLISRNGLVVILLVTGYIFLVEALGFFVLTPILLFAIPLVVGFRNHAANAASAVLVTAALYAVFVLVLNIPLPAGMLGD